MDKISKELRSRNMSRIQRKDTKPELAVRSILHNNGFRFRLHRKDLPGTPDVVLPKYRAVIFIHGCFWHRHKGCRLAYEPKSRTAFWNAKFEENMMRDASVCRRLRRCGWRVAVVWECEVADPNCVMRRILDLIRHR